MIVLVMMASSLQRPGIIVHDQEEAEARLVTRPRGSRGRGEEGLHNSPPMKWNHWPRCPKHEDEELERNWPAKRTKNQVDDSQ